MGFHEKLTNIDVLLYKIITALQIYLLTLHALIRYGKSSCGRRGGLYVDTSDKTID